jgi:predicted nucleic acid-binding Zn ribbon protein
MTFEYKKTKDPSHISGLLKESLSAYTKKSSSGMTAIWDKWDEAVGSQIAENAKPAAYKGNILIVYVSNSTWMQHLRFLTEDIIKKVNTTIGSEAVKEIKYKIGNIHS